MEDLTQGRTPSGEPPEPVDALPDALLADLSSIDGVRGWLPLHTNPVGAEVPFGDFLLTGALVSCRELAALPDLGRCAPGARGGRGHPLARLRPGAPWTTSGGRPPRSRPPSSASCRCRASA